MKFLEKFRAITTRADLDIWYAALFGLAFQFWWAPEIAREAGIALVVTVAVHVLATAMY